MTSQDPEAAAGEIERIMGPLGLNGVTINSHTGGRYLDEAQFAPLLDAAEASRAPVYLHPRAPSMLAAYREYGIPGVIWGYQAEAVLHAMRLILAEPIPPGLVCVPVTDPTPRRMAIAWSQRNQRPLVATFVQAALNASRPQPNKA